MAPARRPRSAGRQRPAEPGRFGFLGRGHEWTELTFSSVFMSKRSYATRRASFTAHSTGRPAEPAPATPRRPQRGFGRTQHGRLPPPRPCSPGVLCPSFCSWWGSLGNAKPVQMNSGQTAMDSARTPVQLVRENPPPRAPLLANQARRIVHCLTSGPASPRTTPPKMSWPSAFLSRNEPSDPASAHF